MLKRITVNQLRVGMHLKEFCGSWMEHPFLRSSFVVTDPKDIEAILASSIHEVWIDCGKGLDVAPGEHADSEAQVEAQIENELRQVADGQRHIEPVGAAAEMGRAARIIRRSKEAVVSMFEEARMGKSVDVGGARLLVNEIADSVARNPGALISLARLKTLDDYTYMHSVAVCAMMVALAKQLGFDEARTRSAGLAGLLHDLGKALVPLEILNKPGRLTEAEFSIIKSHPREGYGLLLGDATLDPMVLEVCLHHHEKVDGSGYPDGLKGDELSLIANMGTVCDVYDAITSNRPYKAGWDPAASLRKMAGWASARFDQRVFHAFVKCMGIYPVGSLVRLTDGRIGVVVEQTEKSLTTPCVKVFFSTVTNLRIPPLVVDLSRPGCTEQIAGREDAAKWHFPDLDELWSGLPSAPW